MFHIAERLELLNELLRDGPRVLVAPGLGEPRDRSLGRRDEVDRDPAIIEIIKDPSVLLLDPAFVAGDARLVDLENGCDLNLRVGAVKEKVPDADAALVGGEDLGTDLLLSYELQEVDR